MHIYTKYILTYDKKCVRIHHVNQMDTNTILIVAEFLKSSGENFRLRLCIRSGALQDKIKKKSFYFYVVSQRAGARGMWVRLPSFSKIPSSSYLKNKYKLENRTKCLHIEIIMSLSYFPQSLSGLRLKVACTHF